MEAIDQSENMITEAQNKYPNVKFQVKDALALDYDREFDAVFSNATLRWIKQPTKVLDCIYHSLKEGGRFVAEFGGKGNVHLMTQSIQKQFESFNLSSFTDNFPWYFPSISEYTTLMEEVGFTVTFAHLFQLPTRLEGDNGLRHWLEMFGKDVFSGLPEEKRQLIMTNIEKDLKDKMFKDNHWLGRLSKNKSERNKRKINYFIFAT